MLVKAIQVTGYRFDKGGTGDRVQVTQVTELQGTGYTGYRVLRLHRLHRVQVTGSGCLYSRQFGLILVPFWEFTGQSYLIQAI